MLVFLRESSVHAMECVSVLQTVPTISGGRDQEVEIADREAAEGWSMCSVRFID